MVAAHGASHNAHSYADAIPELVSTLEASLVGVIKADQITANTDNYAPLGYQTNNVYRIDLDADHNLTGLAGGTENAVRCLINISTHVLTLKHDATSTAANRLFLNFSADQPLDPNGAAIFRYDTLSSRWRLISLTTDYSAMLADDVATGARVTALEAAAEVVAYLAAGQQLTSNSTTMQTITGLKVTMAANKTYRFSMTLIYLSTVAADINWQFTGPAGSTLFYSTGNYADATGAVTIQNSIGLTSPLNGAGAGVNIAIEIFGTVFCGATPGDLQFQAAQKTATVETTDFVVQGSNIVSKVVH